jgi:hypothetical protein
MLFALLVAAVLVAITVRVGYGDLVLPKPWWMFGPVGRLTGILMCGLSSGLFFAVVTRIYTSRFEQETK